MIARKYALVLMQRDDWEYFYSKLSFLHELLVSNKDFLGLLSSKIVKFSHKVKIILELFEDNTKEFENLIYLLADNSRLSLISEIFLNMQQYKMERENVTTAIVYTASPLSADVLKSLENDLSKKFSVNVKLLNKISDSDNVKIVLDSLGYEINISPSYLKHKIKEFILKAI